MKAVLCILLLCALAGCSKGEKEFFEKGKKVKSGFIWEKQQIPAEEVLKGRTLKNVFEDSFDRPALGAHWNLLGGDWKIENNTVFSPIAENKNLVLKGVAMPQNAVVELDMWSKTDYVDIKFNLYGDGNTHEHGDGYTFIMGGWQNRMSVITRLHEHEENRYEERDTRWEPNTPYHIKVIRLDKKIYWYVNNSLFLVYYDQNPLKTNDGYKYLSFANWRSKSYFDNLKIYEIMEK